MYSLKLATNLPKQSYTISHKSVWTVPGKATLRLFSKNLMFPIQITLYKYIFHEIVSLDKTLTHRLESFKPL